MRGLLVFNNLNDVVYVNCCTRFVGHVARLAKSQGLVGSEFTTLYGRGKKAIDPNILIQLFSPLVTSQRFMKEQFGNPYASVQCEDGTNIVFQEFMGHLFLRVGTEEINHLKRSLGVSIRLVSYICGPDVGLLKTVPRRADYLDDLLKTWNALQSCDQSFLVEALEQMTVNSQFSTTLIKSLQHVCGRIQVQNECVQALLITDTKLLSWYSSKGAFQLAAEDILVIILMLQNIWPGHNLRNFLKKRIHYTKLDDHSSVTTTSSSSETDSDDLDWESKGFYGSKETFLDDIDDFAVVQKNEEKGVRSLSGEFRHYLVAMKNGSQYVPHRIHMAKVQDNMYLVFLLEPPASPLITSLSTLIQIATVFNGNNRDVTMDKQYLEGMEASMKKILDFLKKQKNQALKNELTARWTRFKTGFQLYLKTKDAITVQINPLIDGLIGAFRLYFNEQNIIYENPKILQPLVPAWNKIKLDTEDFWEYHKVTYSRAVGLGSRNSPSINKYLEQFQGLIHFVYIDRNNHSVNFPSLEQSSSDHIKLTKRKIWSMVKFAREHMQQGHFSLMWKDSAFHFSYFLWFEDLSGTSIRPKSPPTLPWENGSMSTLPGILCGDFYKRLVQECFPGSNYSKIRCLELFCIHMSLVASSMVLEQSKRLAATIHNATRVTSSVDVL